MKAWVALAALAMLFGCVAQERAPETAGVENACISECQRAMLSGRDLSAGPCLLNPVPDYPGWVCDVAHSPREAVDSVTGNQCSAFANGSAKHFIEVAPDCIYIREY